MPLYVCTTPVGALDDDKRRRLAEDITAVHCDVTGAPPTFVQVVYFEDPASLGKPSVTAKRRLVEGVRRVTADAAGVAPADVAVTTRDTPAKWIMEGGELLPEPGEEAAWLERHPAPNRAGVG
jgi:phenylpyruvate tautomerase PptA (4-oxalocrotonate tautomerase family)